MRLSDLKPGMFISGLEVNFDESKSTDYHINKFKGRKLLMSVNYQDFGRSDMIDIYTDNSNYSICSDKSDDVIVEEDGILKFQRYSNFEVYSSVPPMLKSSIKKSHDAFVGLIGVPVLYIKSCKPKGSEIYRDFLVKYTVTGIIGDSLVVDNGYGLLLRSGLSDNFSEADIEKIKEFGGILIDNRFGTIRNSTPGFGKNRFYKYGKTKQMRRKGECTEESIQALVDYKNHRMKLRKSK